MTQRHPDSDDDTFVTVGRPFEQLETAEDIHKAKVRKEKEQYVTDSEGRRRFHGAFTGGFSAGYYNTVGSKEGWAPSTFVSTRDKRNSFGGQRPEDFMDEEDFGAHGIAPKVVSAREKFSQGKEESEIARKRSQPESSVIPGGPPLENLIVPSKSTIGARLLKAMGWREGEGVGPKVMKYPTQAESEMYYGPSRQEDAELIRGTPSKTAEGFMFAPRDSTSWHFEGKDDLHGVGYRGIEQQGVLRSNKSTRSLYGMSGEAFGTGALDNDDDDEDNVYGVESMTSYDITLAGEGDLSMERKFGWTGRDSQNSDSWDLSSFAKALNPPPLNKSYPPPSVPRNFVPVHKFKAENTPLNRHAESSTQKPLTSVDRSQLLTENKGSVFGLLSPSDRGRLKQAAERTKAHLKSTTERHSEQHMAEAMGSVTEWEKEKEKEKLAHAAAIFKPLGTALASRFTRSQDTTEAPKSPESDAIQAARANLFGVLTREIQDWYPHRIVCKRFNVPDPYSGCVGVVDSKKNERQRSLPHTDARGINFQPSERKFISELPDSSPTEETVREKPQELVLLSSKEASSNKQQNSEPNEEDQPRPPMDLFKAIFADSSSDSGQSSDESERETGAQRLQSVDVQGSDKMLLALKGKHWQDLSVVTSLIQQPQPQKLHPIISSPPVVTVGNGSKNLKQTGIIDETHHQHDMRGESAQHSDVHKESIQIMSYGPALPPDVSMGDSDEGANERHSLSGGQGRPKHHHKKSHKKHTIKDVRKEHKKRKHKHSTHKKDN